MSRGRSVLFAFAALLGAMLTGLLSLLGVSLPFAVAWGVLVVVGVAVAPGMDIDPEAKWPPPEPRRAARGSEVARLAWSFNLSNDTAGRAAHRRVLELLQRRLERHGIDLEDAAGPAEAARLLGMETIEAVLVSEPRREDIDGLLDALDRLEQRSHEKRTS